MSWPRTIFAIATARVTAGWNLVSSKRLATRDWQIVGALVHPLREVIPNTGITQMALWTLRMHMAHTTAVGSYWSLPKTGQSNAMGIWTWEYYHLLVGYLLSTNSKLSEDISKRTHKNRDSIFTLKCGVLKKDCSLWIMMELSGRWQCMKTSFIMRTETTPSYPNLRSSLVQFSLTFLVDVSRDFLKHVN